MRIYHKKILATAAAIAIATPTMAFATDSVKPVEKRTQTPPPVEASGSSAAQVETSVGTETRPAEKTTQTPPPVATSQKATGEAEVDADASTKPVEKKIQTPPPVKTMEKDGESK